MTLKRNAFYAQSGGVTSVINASACGVIETAAKSKKINKVLCGQNGILGALNENLIDTSKESKSTIAKLKNTPGGAFGSCRFKLQDPIAQKRNTIDFLRSLQLMILAIFFTMAAEIVKTLLIRFQKWRRSLNSLSSVLVYLKP